MAKANKKIPKAAADIVAAALSNAGVPVRNNNDYIGRKVYGRKSTSFARVAGTITATSVCNLEGCRGLRLHVRWPDGKRTRPCSKGCDFRKDGNLQII